MGVRKGKLIAQGAHASLISFIKAQGYAELLHDPNSIADYKYDAISTKWFKEKQTKICVYVNSEKELDEIYAKAQAAGLPSTLVIDAGLTEFNGIPTKTCVGIGPAEAEEIDKITGGLPLL